MLARAAGAAAAGLCPLVLAVLVDVPLLEVRFVHLVAK